MTSRLAVVALLAPSVAFADQRPDPEAVPMRPPVQTREAPVIVAGERAAPMPTGSLGLGMVVGGDLDPIIAFELAADRRLGATPLYAHGELVGGSPISVFDHGSYSAVRGGLELRRCDGACALVGVDLGRQHIERTGSSGFDGDSRHDEASHWMVVPRVAVELGATSKLRLGFELPVLRDTDRMTTAGPFGYHRDRIGALVTLGFGFYR